MRSYWLSFILGLGLCFAGYSQSREQLMGTWQLFKYSSDGREKFVDSANLLSFYEKDYECISSPYTKYTVITTGGWQVSEGQLIFKKLHFVSCDSGTCEDLFYDKRERMKVLSLTTGELVLKNEMPGEFFPYDTMYLKKAPDRARMDILAICKAQQNKQDSIRNAEAAEYRKAERMKWLRIDSLQRYHLVLIDTARGRKAILNPKGEITIQTGTDVSYTKYRVATFQALDDSFLYIHPYYQQIYLSEQGGYTTNRQQSFSILGRHEKDTVLRIERRLIDHISYSSPARQRTHGFFAATGWMAFITSTIVSPLISINYRHWSFDKSRYLKTAGISMGYAIASLTVCLSTQEAWYYLTKRSWEPSCWKIAKIIYD